MFGEDELATIVFSLNFIWRPGWFIFIVLSVALARLISKQRTRRQGVLGLLRELFYKFTGYGLFAGLFRKNRQRGRFGYDQQIVILVDYLQHGNG